MTAKELNDTTIPLYDSPSEESLLPIFEPRTGITGKTALATIRDMFALFLDGASAEAEETEIGGAADAEVSITREGLALRADFRFRIPVAGLGERIAAIESTAETASATADEAKSTAETASATADQAKSTAETASATADQAKSTAEAASATADEAKSTAEAASATADEAKSTAETASATAARVEAAVNEVLGAELEDGAGAIRAMIDERTEDVRAAVDALNAGASTEGSVRALVAAEEEARMAAEDAIDERTDRLAEDIRAASGKIGDLSELTTVAKSSLVAALNEANRTTIYDTRDTNQTPEWYMRNCPKSVRYEFKYSSVIGIGLSAPNGTLVTYTGWSDKSGLGSVSQHFYVGNAYYSRGAATETSWSAWVRQC